VTVDMHQYVMGEATRSYHEGE